MSERQRHGLTFEQYLQDKLLSFERTGNYTAAHDGIIALPSGGLAASIKIVTGRGEMCMADMGRIVSGTDSLALIYAHRRRKMGSGIAAIEKIRCCYLPSGTAGLFGDQHPRAALFAREFKDYMTGNLVDYSSYCFDPERWDFNDYAADAAWRKDKKAFDERYCGIFGDETIWVRPRPKRDHKKQRRLQCAIPGRMLGEFYSTYGVGEIQASDFDERRAWEALEEALVEAAN